MKRFFVAAFCTLLMSGSLLAQEAATNVAPVAPVEDVAVAPVAPVATGSVIAPQVAGCNNCGSVVAPAYAPMTYTAAPIQSGCSSCGSVMPVSYATPMPIQGGGCGGCAAPVASCCPAPVDPCCDPCAQGQTQRKGLFGKRRVRRAARRNTVTAY